MHILLSNFPYQICYLITFIKPFKTFWNGTLPDPGAKLNDSSFLLLQNCYRKYDNFRSSLVCVCVCMHSLVKERRKQNKKLWSFEKETKFDNILSASLRCGTSVWMQQPTTSWKWWLLTVG